MSECKRIITPNSICSESALDAVCKLVSAGMKVQPACNLVAEEYQKNYPEDKADSETLRRQYYRANPTKKSVTRHSSKEKKCDMSQSTGDNIPNSPTSFVTTDLFVTIEKYNIAIDNNTKLQNRIKQLEQALDDVSKVLDAKVMADSPAPTNPQVDSNNTTITRPTAFTFVKERGNEFQNIALKSDDLDNDRLFRLLVAVRNAYLERNPPFSLPKEILNATGIRDDI